MGIFVAVFYLLSMGWGLLKGIEWGEKKEVVLEPVYDEVGDFKEGSARVKKGDKWGFIKNPLGK